MATLLNGFGGAAGFGENYLTRNDDSYQNGIDITSVFGAQGLNFFGTSYTALSINNNGNITFGNSGLSAFTPFGLQGSSYAMIAAFFGDVDTRISGASPTAGGTSTGSNLVWYDLDPLSHKLTITWDDVGYYSYHTDKLNAFQIQLTGTGGGGFDIDFRYEDINWTTGSASGGSNGLGGSVARAGYSTGDSTTWFELPQSGNQAAMLALESTAGNTGIAGLYHFGVNSSLGLLAADTILSLQGNGNVNVGLIRTMADFSKAAYHLEATENRVINDFSPNADETITTNPNAALTDLGHQGWQAIRGLTPAFQSATSVIAGQTITNTMFTDGFYVNGNAAACVMRCGDAAVISFRGTNDNGKNTNQNDWSNTIHPDADEWGAIFDGSNGDMNDHYSLLQPLITAFDQYISGNGISKVYVTGHSLGGAMAIKYMSNHLAVDRPGIEYQATTFAAPAFTGSNAWRTGFGDDSRITQIEISEDPVPVTWDVLANQNRPGDVIRFAGDQTLNEPNYHWTFWANDNNHSMDYYRQITDSVDADSWATILQGTGDQTVFLGGRTYVDSFVVDGQLSGTNTPFDTGVDTLTDPLLTDYNFIYGGQGNDTLTGGGASETFLGGIGADAITGAAGNDTYYVDNPGDTTIESGFLLGGWDSVYTRTSFTLAASVEAMVLTGTAAINATGNAEHNYLVGNNAGNVLDGQGGADDMVGGAGNDTYSVDIAGDTVTEKAGEGWDTVWSSIHYALGNNVEALWFYGTTNLNGWGNAQNNSLGGNSGNNRLDGQGGADAMSGGIGDDIYIVENAGDVVTETTAVGGGWDGVYANVSYSLGANVEALVLTGTTGTGAYGNAVHNYLVGNDAGNTLDGRGGADDMAGGLGGDIYYIDNLYDTTIEGSGAGWDSVYSSTLSYTLSINVEALVLLEGSTATTAIGNTAYNYIVGNSAADIFDGRGGGDFMVGGKGNDTYNVYNSYDTIVEYANEGWDVVWASTNYVLSSANVEDLRLSGTANINGYGNSDHNYLVGNSGNNLLDGQEGNDTIFGGEGADTFVGSLGRDVYNLTETTAATDTIRIATGDSLVAIGSYDFAVGFKLGTGTVSTAGVDKLDLASTSIAANATAVDGANSGAIMSHSISNGIISFDDINNYTTPMTITGGYLPGVFDYLQANITGSNTVAFVSEGNTYVFQDGGVTDTLVELVGVVASSLNTTGLAANSVWIA